jgi:trimethyllysine dioxygenase
MTCSSSFWLRDSCVCTACRHPTTNQRLVDTFNLPWDIEPTSVEYVDKGVRVTCTDTGAEYHVD